MILVFVCLNCLEKLRFHGSGSRQNYATSYYPTTTQGLFVGLFVDVSAVARQNCWRVLSTRSQYFDLPNTKLLGDALKLLEGAQHPLLPRWLWRWLMQSSNKLNNLWRTIAMQSREKNMLINNNKTNTVKHG